MLPHPSASGLLMSPREQQSFVLFCFFNTEGSMEFFLLLKEATDTNSRLKSSQESGSSEI